MDSFLASTGMQKIPRGGGAPHPQRGGVPKMTLDRKMELERQRTLVERRISEVKSEMVEHIAGKSFEQVRDDLARAPPKKDLELAKYILVDSAQRDRLQFPSSTSFSVDIDGIHNVCKAELVQAKMPLTDPAVNEINNHIRFSISLLAVDPPVDVYDAIIPVGSYTGTALALEITTQMNIVYWASDITVGSKYVDYDTGMVHETVGDALAAINAKCVYNASQQKFSFSLVDSTGDVLTTYYLRLYARSLTVDGAPADDLFDILGFSRVEFMRVGELDEGMSCYAISSNVQYTNGFHGGDNLVDVRFHHTLTSNEVAELCGITYVNLVIEELKCEDALGVRHDQVAYKGPVFARIYLKDGANSGDKNVDFSNNNYPSGKHTYPQGLSCNSLTISVYRPDGTLANFGNNDFSLTLVLTSKATKTQEETVFA